VDRHVIDWLFRYGAPVLFFAQLFGIFGLPIPDELLLTLAGVLVRRGDLGGASVLTAAVAGCAAGITISYLLGRTVGLATLQRGLRISDKALARGQAWFRRFGCWLLAFGYFIPGVRHVTALAAGSAPIDYGTFSKFAYPGAVLWSTAFVTIGYVAGDRWQLVLGLARQNLLILSLAAIAAIGAWVWSTRQAT